jgi:hypothetical protein
MEVHRSLHIWSPELLSTLRRGRRSAPSRTGLQRRCAQYTPDRDRESHRLRQIDCVKSRLLIRCRLQRSGSRTQVPERRTGQHWGATRAPAQGQLLTGCAIEVQVRNVTATGGPRVHTTELWLLTVLRLLLQTRATLIAENLFLRKQFAMFQERNARPRRAEPAEPLAVLALAGSLKWREVLLWRITLPAGAMNPEAIPSPGSGSPASTSTPVRVSCRVDGRPRRVISRISAGEGGFVTGDIVLADHNARRLLTSRSDAVLPRHNRAGQWRQRAQGASAPGPAGRPQAGSARPAPGRFRQSPGPLRTAFRGPASSL